MDIQIASIIMIFVVLFILETIDDSNTESFTNFPNQECSSCVLEENSVAFPYKYINELGDETNSLQGKVALQCKNNMLHNLSFVAGRETGRTRQCRKLF